MGAVIDSSWLIAVEREVSRDPGARIQLPADGLVSAVTIAELYFGLELADEAHRAFRSRFIEEVLRVATVLPFGVREAREYARIAADLRRAGATIGERDLIIAATALANGHSVVTLNAAEFSRVPGLDVVPNPLTPDA